MSPITGSAQQASQTSPSNNGNVGGDPLRMPDGSARRQARRAGRWAGCARGSDDARRLDLGRRRPHTGGLDRSRVRAAAPLGEAPPPLADPDPARRRRPRRIDGDRLPRPGDLGQRPDRGRRGRRAGRDRRLGLGPDDRLLAGPRDRPLLRRPGRPHQPDQGPARLLGPLLAGRGAAAHRHLPRLHLGDLENARPAADLRVPRRRAQDDLLLRGRRRADARSGRSSTRASIPAAAPASC